MGERKDKIGIREFFAIASFLIGMKITDDVPALLFDNFKTAGWMGVIISGLMVILPLILLLNIAKTYKDKDLIEMINHLFGKYVGFIVLFLLWVVSFFYIVLDTATYTDIITTMYYVKTPPVVVYGLLVVVCAYCAKRGLEQIGSVSWALYPYVQITFLFGLCLIIAQGKSVFLFPIFGPGEWEVIKNSAISVSLYIDFLYLFILFPYVRTARDFKKGTWAAFFLYILIFASFMVGFAMLFDYNSVLLLNYPYHEAIRSVTLGFLTNLETFFFPFWLIGMFVRFSIYFYINIHLFGKLFKINEFEYMIPAFAALILFLGLIPQSPTFSIFSMKEMVGQFLSPVLFILPMVMWALAKFKGDMSK